MPYSALEIIPSDAFISSKNFFFKSRLVLVPTPSGVTVDLYDVVDGI